MPKVLILKYLGGNSFEYGYYFIFIGDLYLEIGKTYYLCIMNDLVIMAVEHENN